MQTFLPYPDFKKSVAVLDNRRIMSQINEATQIFKAAVGMSEAWKNHPIVKMWKGHEGALLDYAQAVVDEALSRGFKLSKNTIDKVQNLRKDMPVTSYDLPKWLGNKAFHDGHQSSLLRKNREHYSKYFSVDDNLDVIYPYDKPVGG